MTTKAQTEREEATAFLRERIKPGETLYTIVRHVARSGMSRKISALQLEGAQHWDWSLKIGKAIGMPVDRDLGAVKVGGCGMDMGFHLVYELSRCLFPDGFGCIGKGCPSNDHSNGDRDYTPHGAFVPWKAEKKASGLYDVESQSHKHWHRDGGYALRQRWL